MITLVVGPLEVNCYIIWDEDTLEAFVIDPGGDADEIKGAVMKKGLKVRYIVNTHGHFDHVGADGELKRHYGAPIAIHRNDARLMADAHDHAIIFGVKTPPQPEADVLLEDGTVLKAGKLSLKVIHTPGHTPGGVSLYAEELGALFTGDTLFAGSVGRSDFEGGSFDELMNSIRTRILPLGEKIKVYPGHGPPTTIGYELKHNPFCSGRIE